jgi:hypothetical protein
MGVYSGNDVDSTGDAEVVLKTPVGTDLLAQQTMANSLPVVIASNQSSVEIKTVAPTIASYSAGFTGLVNAAAATDVLTITGSATKTIKVTRISFGVSTTAGSGLSFNASILKRSTANSGGTSTVATNVSNDSNNAAATAVVLGYTANPTTGTLVGIVRSIRAEAVTVGATRNQFIWDFGVGVAQPIVLRGTSQVLALNFNGITLTAPVGSYSIEWTEE